MLTKVGSLFLLTGGYCFLYRWKSSMISSHFFSSEPSSQSSISSQRFSSGMQLPSKHPNSDSEHCNHSCHIQFLHAFLCVSNKCYYDVKRMRKRKLFNIKSKRHFVNAFSHGANKTFITFFGTSLTPFTDILFPKSTDFK